MTIESPTQVTGEMPAGVLGNAPQTPSEGEAAMRSHLETLFDTQLSPQEVSEDSQPDNSEVTSEEKELQPEVSTEDETPVEAESSEETEEQLAADEEDSQPEETEIYSYDDIKGLTFEFDGRKLTGAQLKSELGQVPAASKATREANEQIKAAEEIKAKSQEDLKSIQSQADLITGSENLAYIGGQLQQRQKEYNQALTDRDKIKADALELEIKDLSNQGRTEYANVVNKSNAHRAEMIQSNNEKLVKMGYGHIASGDSLNADEAKAHIEFVETIMPRDSYYRLATSPEGAAIIAALEDQRRYKSAQTVKPVKKQSSKTLPKSSSVNKKASAVNRDNELMAKVNSGRATPEEVYQALENQINKNMK